MPVTTITDMERGHHPVDENILRHGVDIRLLPSRTIGQTGNTRAGKNILLRSVSGLCTVKNTAA